MFSGELLGSTLESSSTKKGKEVNNNTLERLLTDIEVHHSNELVILESNSMNSHSCLNDLCSDTRLGITLCYIEDFSKYNQIISPDYELLSEDEIETTAYNLPTVQTSENIFTINEASSNTTISERNEVPINDSNQEEISLEKGQEDNNEVGKHRYNLRDRGPNKEKVKQMRKLNNEYKQIRHEIFNERANNFIFKVDNTIAACRSLKKVLKKNKKPTELKNPAFAEDPAQSRKTRNMTARTRKRKASNNPALAEDPAQSRKRRKMTARTKKGKASNKTDNYVIEEQVGVSGTGVSTNDAVDTQDTTETNQANSLPEPLQNDTIKRNNEQVPIT